MKINVKYLENYDLEKWGPLRFSKEGDSAVDLRAAIKEPITLVSASNFIIKFIQSVFLNQYTSIESYEKIFKKFKQVSNLPSPYDIEKVIDRLLKSLK